MQLTAAQEAALRAPGHGADLDVERHPRRRRRCSHYNVELRPATFGERQNIWSLYVEDLWSRSSSRLNLTLGLALRLRQPVEGRLERRRRRTTWRRAWPSTTSSTTAARYAAGYGVFYDKVLYAVHSDALQQNSTSAGFRSQLEPLIALGILPADTDLDRVRSTATSPPTSSAACPTSAAPPPTRSRAPARQIIGNERRILNPNGYQNPLDRAVLARLPAPARQHDICSTRTSSTPAPTTCSACATSTRPRPIRSTRPTSRCAPEPRPTPPARWPSCPEAAAAHRGQRDRRRRALPRGQRSPWRKDRGGDRVRLPRVLHALGAARTTPTTSTSAPRTRTTSTPSAGRRSTTARTW